MRIMVASYMNSNQTLEAYIVTDICENVHATIDPKANCDNNGWVPVLAFPEADLKEKRDNDQEDPTYSTIADNSDTHNATNIKLGDVWFDTACGLASQDDKVVTNYGDCDLQKYDVTGNIVQNQNMSLATYDHIKMDDKSDEYLWHILIPESEDTGLTFQFEANEHM